MSTFQEGYLFLFLNLLFCTVSFISPGNTPKQLEDFLGYCTSLGLRGNLLIRTREKTWNFKGSRKHPTPPPLEALTSFPCMILRISTCTSGGPVSFLISNKRLCPSRHTSFLWRPVNESTLAYSPVRYLCSKSDLPETELPTMPCIEKIYFC